MPSRRVPVADKLTCFLFFLSFFFFWAQRHPPRLFLSYLFAKSVRNSLFLKRKSTQGKARVGHTNALFKCTSNLSLSLLRVFYPRERGDRSSLSSLFFTPLSSSSRNEKKSQTLLSGRWRVKERRKFSPFCARAFFFSLCVRAFGGARCARSTRISTKRLLTRGMRFAWESFRRREWVFHGRFRRDFGDFFFFFFRQSQKEREGAANNLSARCALIFFSDGCARARAR